MKNYALCVAYFLYCLLILWSFRIILSMPFLCFLAYKMTSPSTQQSPNWEIGILEVSCRSLESLLFLSSFER